MKKSTDLTPITFLVTMRDAPLDRNVRLVPIRFTKSGKPLNQEARTFLKVIRAGVKAMKLPGKLVRVSFS
jgi:hypothetical protein